MSEPPGEAGAHDDRTVAALTARARPFYCPYCGEEDFVPIDDQEGEFHCRSCDRRFAVHFLGLGAPPTLPARRPPSTPAQLPRSQRIHRSVIIGE